MFYDVIMALPDNLGLLRLVYAVQVDVLALASDGHLLLVLPLYLEAL